MRLELNLRGNGACPLCSRIQACPIRRRLAEAIASSSSSADAGESDALEAVVYSCPQFMEMDGS